MAGHRPPASSGARPAVIVLPAEIDIANASQVGALLATACNRESGTVIADMTGTTFCDSTGWHAIASASTRAARHGISLSVVITSPALRRVFTILGLDTVLRAYPDLDIAVAQTGSADPA